MAAEPLGNEDLALLDRLATRVAELRMETPAILAIESARPLSLVASQAMVFFEPFVQALFRLEDYRRYAALVERREALDALVERIEGAVDRRDSARRSAASGERR
ncbi:MAG: hypothetical protein HZA61_05795 [Candidatus Eisenbacteria bacterium]|uniref:Uncharacterized protein n=1 Tax=Eiseniibacteriota bacterium TaxID=2212470 RepID=A0A933SBY9_UNCEI|nr:hypothetical protein [Candidatus Eisenbacteria bacterium]